MVTRVVDTNVLLVADNAHPHVGRECIEACVNLLSHVRDGGQLVIDDQRRILLEYLSAIHRQRNKGVGYAFAKWAAQNLSNSTKITQVHITESSADWFDEFPGGALQEEFDRADRKFIATCAAHPDKPPVVQATDSKWVGFWKALHVFGVNVEFICPDDICRFYAQKYPDRDDPELP